MHSFASAASTKVGTSGAQFLKLGVNARALGMGEAYHAVADGADAVYWNPAGLDRIAKRAISVMHAAYLADIYYDFASYAQKIGKYNALGVGIQYLSARDINRTDEFGTDAGTYSPNDLAVSLGYSRRFSGFSFSFEDEEEEQREEFVLGISAKLIRSRIVETASTGAADVGLLWMPFDKWWLSVGAQNIGAPLKFKNEGDDLPLNFKVGSSYTLFKSLLLAADFNAPRDGNPFGAFGMEYTKRLDSRMWFAGRAGINSRASRDTTGGLTSLSLGTGMGWREYGIDFAWTPFGNLGNAYRASLSIQF